jgi:hypothetical protein
MSSGSNAPPGPSSRDQLNGPRAGERVDPHRSAHALETRGRPCRLYDGALDARQLLAYLGHRHQLNLRVLEEGQELQHAVALGESLFYESLGGEREPHDVVRANLAFEEEHGAGTKREERAHDLLDLGLDPLPELLWRERVLLHQHAPDARARWQRGMGVLGGLELLAVQHAASNETLTQAVDPLVRARKDDLASVQVDALLGARMFEMEQTRLARQVDQLQHVGEGEGPNVRTQDQWSSGGK